MSASVPVQTEAARHGWRVLAILSALMGFASISTDLYLPAMPAMGWVIALVGIGSLLCAWLLVLQQPGGRSSRTPTGNRARRARGQLARHRDKLADGLPA